MMGTGRGGGDTWPLQTLWTGFSPARVSRPVGMHLLQSCPGIYQRVASQHKHYGERGL